MAPVAVAQKADPRVGFFLAWRICSHQTRQPNIQIPEYHELISATSLLNSPRSCWPLHKIAQQHTAPTINPTAKYGSSVEIQPRNHAIKVAHRLQIHGLRLAQRFTQT
jgi:hypothetical protein